MTENMIIRLKKNLNFNEKNKNFKHNINIDAPLLPFQTRNPERVKFMNEFKGITGEFLRLALDTALIEEIEVDSIINNIVASVDVEDSDSPYLELFIKNYLMNSHNKINIVHPYLVQYINLSEGKQKVGEEAIALFLRDILIENNSCLEKVFKQKETEHILCKLILNHLPDLKEVKNDKKYIGKLDFIKKVFNEDINYLSSFPNYLIKNIDLILAYYYFFYCSQLILKLAKKFKSDLSIVEEVYYLLDWESLSKNRKTVNLGYKYIHDYSRDVLVNINLLEHFNTLCGQKGMILTELKNFLDEEKNNVFLNNIYEWINQYRELKGLDKLNISGDLTVEVLEAYHYKSLKDKIEPATCSRYSKNLEEIAKKYFLKLRGSYGYTLNITQEFLLLITSLCIKEQKITLKQLFIEYEKRGLFFDRYSKEEIINLLNNLNLIEKKSDSGDAQYVKSIL